MTAVTKRIATLRRLCGYKFPLEKRKQTRAATRRWKERNREKVKLSEKAYNTQRKAQRHRLHLRVEYGLTADIYEAMLLAQHGRCACCLRPFKRTPNVDHCHKTKKVRGLLCGSCNRGIGLFGDDPKQLLLAVKYLERSQS